VKKKSMEKIEAWLDTADRVSVEYPDIAAEAVQQAIALGKS
jgi:SRSO17 transposase